MPEGLGDVLSNLERLPKAITANALEVATDTGNAILDVAKQNCPVRTGRLQRSGFVKVIGFEVQVGFETEYAATVHEDTSSNHDNGQAKFLETPFKAAERTLPEDIARKGRL